MDEKYELSTGFQRRLGVLVECAPFRYTILTLIVINAVILGLQTSSRAMAEMGTTLALLDQVILWIFVGEIVLRITAHGRKFFRDPW